MKRVFLLTFILALVFTFSLPRVASALSEADAADLSIARAAMAAGDAAAALSIYDRLVDEYPENTDLRLEAARAHHAAGSAGEALRLGRQVLREYEKRRFQFRGTARMGFLYDSNVNQGPASEHIQLGNWGVWLSDGIGKASAGAYFGANTDMGWRLSAISPWWIVGDVNIFLRGNFSKEMKSVNSRRLHWARGAAGIRYLDGSNLFDMRLKAEVLDYDFDSRVNGLGFEARYARVVTPRLQLITDMVFERRNYSGNDDRAGNFGRVGGYARFLFGEAGHEFLFGGGYLGASADNSNYSYDGWQSLARFSFRLPNGFTISPQVSFTQEFYDGPGTALETEKRRDDRLRIGADLAYAINEVWNVEAAYYYMNSNSTSNLYKYDQHVISLGVSRKF